MAITVRKANQKDADFIVKMNKALAFESENLLLDEAILHEGVAGCLEDSLKGFYFIAEIDGEIVGQLMITFEWSDWRNGWIWWVQSVYVAAEFRRMGLFKTLFRHIENLAKKEKDVVALRLYVESNNNHAKNVYQKVGMKYADYQVFQKYI